MSSENREDVESATKLLEDAVGTDPKFALAWTELARAYYIKAFYYTPEQSKELNLKAQFAMRRRCRLILIWLKRTSFAAYSYGHMQTDFPTNRRSSRYKRALLLNPKLDEAHHQLGLVVLSCGLTR
jgi:hypothetical protein